MASSGCRGTDSVELLEIQHTLPRAPAPLDHVPHYGARPHPVSLGSSISSKHCYLRPSSPWPMPLPPPGSYCPWPAGRSRRTTTPQTSPRQHSWGILQRSGWLWMTQMKCWCSLVSGKGGKGNAIEEKARWMPKDYFSNAP